MRDFKKFPEAGDLDLLNGTPLTDPLTQVNLAEDGGSVEPVHPVATEDGEPQAALSRGGFGTLTRAGSP